MGLGGFFPTNPDLVDILGRTDVDFANFLFWDSKFQDFQVPRFPGPQISRSPEIWPGPSLGRAWAGFLSVSFSVGSLELPRSTCTAPSAKRKDIEVHMSEQKGHLLSCLAMFAAGYGPKTIQRHWDIHQHIILYTLKTYGGILGDIIEAVKPGMPFGHGKAASIPNGLWFMWPRLRLMNIAILWSMFGPTTVCVQEACAGVASQCFTWDANTNVCLFFFKNLVLVVFGRPSTTNVCFSAGSCLHLFVEVSPLCVFVQDTAILRCWQNSWHLPLDSSSYQEFCAASNSSLYYHIGWSLVNIIQTGSKAVK